MSSAKTGQIEVASNGGFCWGVKRAMTIAANVAARSESTVFTYGPLIHNRSALADLERANARAVERLDQVKSGQTLIIRAHGVAPIERVKARERGLNIVDATCPLVARVQGIIKKFSSKGYVTIIIGDIGHAEVVGLIGYTRDKFHVIKSRADVAELPADLEKVNVVAQTTLDERAYFDIVAAISERYPSAIAHNTICEATRERQEEARRLARAAQTVFIVGGASSANTRRLTQISQAEGARAYQIETPDQISPDQISPGASIAVLAGASTPTWLIEAVVEKIDSARAHRGARTRSRISALLRRPIPSALVAALEAVLIIALNSTIVGYRPDPILAALAGLTIFSTEIARGHFSRHRSTEIPALFFIAPALLALIGAVALVSILTALIFACALGFSFWRSARESSGLGEVADGGLVSALRSREISISLTWFVALFIAPAWLAESIRSIPALIVAALFTVALAYIRAAFVSIDDVERDVALDRSAAPAMIGLARANMIVKLLALTLLIALSLTAFFDYARPLSAFFVILPFYALVYVRWRENAVSRPARRSKSLLFETLIFVFASAVVLWRLIT